MQEAEGIVQQLAPQNGRPCATPQLAGSNDGVGILDKTEYIFVSCWCVERTWWFRRVTGFRTYCKAEMRLTAGPISCRTYCLPVPQTYLIYNRNEGLTWNRESSGKSTNFETATHNSRIVTPESKQQVGWNRSPANCQTEGQLLESAQYLHELQPPRARRRFPWSSLSTVEATAATTSTPTPTTQPQFPARPIRCHSSQSTDPSTVAQPSTAQCRKQQTTHRRPASGCTVTSSQLSGLNSAQTAQASSSYATVSAASKESWQLQCMPKRPAQPTH
jgi:hypothetical protein